jgi:hypothetical protein
MKRVLLTVMHGGWICDDTVSALLDLRVERRVELTIERPQTTASRPYVSVLNATARMMVSEGFDFWINLDADNTPRRNPVDLIFCDKDVIGCPYPIWIADKEPRPYLWSTFDHAPDKGEYEYRMHKPLANELEQVDAVASGCMVVARRVLEHSEMKAPFNRIWDEWGEVVCGTDLAFCGRARKAGFEVWAHFGCPCEHLKEIRLTGAAMAIESTLAGTQRASEP